MRAAVAVAVMILAIHCTVPPPSAPPVSAPPLNALFALDGTWKGQVKGFQASGLAKRPLDYELWITIAGDEVHLWYFHEDRWVRPWNGSRNFSIARHKSNAVIFASNSKPETECHWVETWTLTVSQFKPGSLEGFWYRVVNNTGCPDYEGTQFAYGATGRLTRVSATIAAPEPQGVY
jgi:hypothetical protein